MARIQDIVFDCVHPASLARFWAAVLDGYRVAPYDEAELERLRGKGIGDPEDDPTVLVEGGPDVTPRLFFQRVPEPKILRNRVRVWLTPGINRDEEVERVKALGATFVTDDRNPDGTGWVVLADPEGNEFCMLRSNAAWAGFPHPDDPRSVTA